MATEVSSVIRLINGCDSNESALAGKSTAPITRDFLGGCSALDSKELDLDLQVPSGWEKRLDLKSGNVYLERCNSSNVSSSTSENKPQSSVKRQDLNFPPLPLNPSDDAALDLKLVLSSSESSMKSSNYQSVCTLDKVKSALERVEKESSRKRSKPSSPHSNSSSSTKDSEIDREEKLSASVATGCPRCLLYVLISQSNPLCPRCNCIVPVSVAVKKPRIDLNISG
ncbi:Hypothetical predicted protein [Olea europaea subsp. europaea]|uniref:GIR1-like zinc ribbon domain-containing protein n=1 Tax=Olea europaea subsp. europaea TaxID=158383 RepID=A0A8S0VP25_OLEEU|nr:Hypothetical predicted protein [Olea europaea subsp. europaea]